MTRPPVGPAAVQQLRDLPTVAELARAVGVRPEHSAPGVKGGPWVALYPCPSCWRLARAAHPHAERRPPPETAATARLAGPGDVRLTCGADCEAFAIAEALWAGIAPAGAPPAELVAPALDGQTSPNGPPPLEPFPPIVVRTAADFALDDEESARGVLGHDETPVIPEGGATLVYGDGGAGKSTLVIDAVCHIAAGDPWLGIPVPRPRRVLVIENEGPRPHFRLKLARKLAGWAGSPIADRVLVLDEPWGRIDVQVDQCRDALAGVIRELEVDVVVLGPISDSGMYEAGTLQQVRAFTALLDLIRDASGRPALAFVLLHHENAAGKVSGAFKPAVETLLRVSPEGNGRTRVYFEKVRWSSAHQGITMRLRWAGVDGFEVDDQPDRTDDDVADEIVEHVRANAGTGWVKVERAITGNGDRLRRVRDDLLADRRIVNIVGKGFDERAEHSVASGTHAHLFVPADPAIRHLCPWLDTVEDTVA